MRGDFCRSNLIFQSELRGQIVPPSRIPLVGGIQKAGLLPTFVGIAMTLSGIFEMNPAKFPHQSAKMQISEIAFYCVLEIFFFHIPDVSIDNIPIFVDDEGGGDCIDVSVLLSNPFVTEDDRV